MQTHHLILFVIGLAFLWGFCVLARAHDAVDPDAHVSIGQISHAEDSFQPTPDGRAALCAASMPGLAQQGPTSPHPAPDSALVRVCGGCWTILGTSPKTVFPGQRFLLSTRETCPQCAAPSSPPDHDQTHREAPLAGGCEAVGTATEPARA